MSDAAVARTDRGGILRHDRMYLDELHYFLTPFFTPSTPPDAVHLLGKSGGAVDVSLPFSARIGFTVRTRWLQIVA